MNSGWQHNQFGVHYCRPTPIAIMAKRAGLHYFGWSEPLDVETRSHEDLLNESMTTAPAYFCTTAQFLDWRGSYGEGMKLRSEIKGSAMLKLRHGATGDVFMKQVSCCLTRNRRCTLSCSAKTLASCRRIGLCETPILPLNLQGGNPDGRR